MLNICENVRETGEINWFLFHSKCVKDLFSLFFYYDVTWLGDLLLLLLLLLLQLNESIICVSFTYIFLFIRINKSNEHVSNPIKWIIKNTYIALMIRIFSSFRTYTHTHMYYYWNRMVLTIWGWCYCTYLTLHGILTFISTHIHITQHTFNHVCVVFISVSSMMPRKVELNALNNKKKKNMCVYMHHLCKLAQQ